MAVFIEQPVQTTETMKMTKVSVCGRCHREGGALDLHQEDRMVQPDGFPCGGTFIDAFGARCFVTRHDNDSHWNWNCLLPYGHHGEHKFYK